MFGHPTEIFRKLMIFALKFYQFLNILKFLDVQMCFPFFPTNFDQLSIQLVTTWAPIWNFTVFW